MKVKMKVDISGTRNGEPWPARGGEVELPDTEGKKLCESGLATPVRSDGDDVETRKPTKARASAEKRGDK